MFKFHLFMKKIICVFILLFCTNVYADHITENYRFIVPATGSRDWAEKISNDIISIDRIMYEISQEVAIISGETAWVDDGTTVRLENPWRSVVVESTVSIDSSATVSGDMAVSGILSVDSGTVYVDASNNRLGVNTISPQQALDVNGDGVIEGILSVDSSATVSGDMAVSGTVSIDDTTLYVDAPNNRVGVGTDSPTAVMDISAGTLNNNIEAFNVTCTLDSSAGAENIGSLWTINTAGSEAQSQRGIKLLMNAGYTGARQVASIRVENYVAGTGNSLNSTGFTGNGATSFNSLGTGTLNVGTHGNSQNATTNIGVVGLSGDDEANQTNYGVRGIAKSTGTGGTAYGGHFSVDATSPNGAALAADNLTTTNDIFQANDNGSTVFAIKNGGNVGIGDTGPDTALEVLDTTAPQLRLTHTDGADDLDFSVDANGDVTIQASGDKFVIQNDTDGTSGVQVLDANGGTPVLNVDTTNERVGIGTATPSVELDVVGQFQAESGVYPVLGFTRTTAVTGGGYDAWTGIASAMKLKTETSGNMTDGFGGGILLVIDDDTSTEKTIARIYARRDGADDSGAIQFAAGTALAPDMTIRASGNVGIATHDPQSILHIVGDAIIDGKVSTDESVTISGDVAVSGHISTDAISFTAQPTIQFTITDPENLPDHSRGDKMALVWTNTSGNTFNVDKIEAYSDEDNYSFRLNISSSLTDVSLGNQTTMDVVSCDTNGTDVYTDTITSGFDDGTVADNQHIMFRHFEHTAGNVSVRIYGHY